MATMGGTVLAAAAAAAALAMLPWVWRACSGCGGAGKLQLEASVLLDWDDERIRVRYPEGEAITVRWDKLASVRIRTTDDGPWRPDVFWLLRDQDGVVLIAPQGATGEDGFLEALERRLPAFDDRAVVEAMGSTDHALFTMWERATAEQGTAAHPALPAETR